MLCQLWFEHCLLRVMGKSCVGGDDEYISGCDGDWSVVVFVMMVKRVEVVFVMMVKRMECFSWRWWCGVMGAQWLLLCDGDCALAPRPHPNLVVGQQHDERRRFCR